VPGGEEGERGWCRERRCCEPGLYAAFHETAPRVKDNPSTSSLPLTGRKALASSVILLFALWHDELLRRRMRGVEWGGQPVLAPPIVPIGLAHPVPDALRRRFELPRQLLRGPPLPEPARRSAAGTPPSTVDGSSASWTLLSISAPTMGCPRNRVNSTSRAVV
jgi:hypothetical protein